MKTGKFNCVVDAAWGSSGKGAVSARLADIYGVPNASSCNYPNAGHTVVFEGKKYVFKSLPSAAVLNVAGKGPQIWLGPDSGIVAEQLSKELLETGYAWRDINIHGRAVMVYPEHAEKEKKALEVISSTMSGSGAAYTEKAMRDAALSRGVPPDEFWALVTAELQRGKGFLHEVSQGFALSINHGTHYPHCTFRDCTPQQAYAQFGITPAHMGDVYLNVRSFPIRVGNNYKNGEQVGYSGDFLPDQTELTWEQIGLWADMPKEEVAALAEKERTTVTKKVRRVATQSWELLTYAARFTGATKVVLNFPQYIHWSAHKARGGKGALQSLHSSVRSYIERLEECTNLPVVMIGTGAEHQDYIFLE